MLFGNQWLLRIYPGGQADSEEGMASFGLWNMSNKAIDIYFGFSVSDGNGKQVAYKRTKTPRNFVPVGVAGISARGCDFVKRSKLMRSLVKGALIIDIH
jgi:hypothetical protein